MTRGGIFTALAAALVLASCSPANLLRGKVDGLREIVNQADRNGAYRCAPRELALARANLDFADVELRQGHVDRAEAHYAVAEPNAHAALRLSPAARCAPREVLLERPAPPGDRDGDGYLDPNDECPDDPEDFDGYEDADGCPDREDVDGDGLDDLADLCVTEPEDRDGYMDTDGCPEPDNDLDTILDGSDRCANDPEDPDGFQDEDGCPDLDNDTDGTPDATDRCPNEPGPPEEQGCPRVYRDVEVTGTHIRIHQTIHFEFNRATIRAVSFPILDTVTQVLRDFPMITIEVQGHTDSRGNDDYNMRLSDARAGAVREYLISHGIDASRLTSRGYGETLPIESNRTAAGRASNRRVEFRRTDAGAQATESPPSTP